MTITCTVSRGKPRPAISRARAHRRGLWENGGRMRRDRALSQCKASKRTRWTGGGKRPRSRAQSTGASVGKNLARSGSHKWHKRLDSKRRNVCRVTADEVAKAGRGQTTGHFHALLRGLDFILQARVFGSVFCLTPVSQYAPRIKEGKRWMVKLAGKRLHTMCPSWEIHRHLGKLSA